MPLTSLRFSLVDRTSSNAVLADFHLVVEDLLQPLGTLLIHICLLVSISHTWIDILLADLLHDIVCLRRRHTTLVLDMLSFAFLLVVTASTLFHDFLGCWHYDLTTLIILRQRHRNII